MIEMARKTHSPKREGSKSHIHLRDERKRGPRSRKSEKERGATLASERGKGEPHSPERQGMGPKLA